jgi:anti-sigma regulatory factor (Ser/Thr protein kinase)
MPTVKTNAPVLNCEDRFVTASKTVYEMSSADLDVANFQLHVLEQLTNAERIDKKTANQIKVCIQEALTNSLDHGNLELDSIWKEEIDEEGIDRYSKVRKERLADGRYASRLIFIDAEFDGSKLQVMIKDQGKGFDITKKIKEAKDNQDNHGRGLLLMKEILDKISFSKGGTEVLLVKTINNK